MASRKASGEDTSAQNLHENTEAMQTTFTASAYRSFKLRCMRHSSSRTDQHKTAQAASTAAAVLGRGGRLLIIPLAKFTRFVRTGV